MSTKRIIRQIAKNHGVSTKQVRADIREAMRFSMMSEAPGAQTFWNELSPGGKEPSVEAFLKMCVQKLKDTAK